MGYQGSIDWETSKPDGTPIEQLDVSRLMSLGWYVRITLKEGRVSSIAPFREELGQESVQL